MIEHHIQREILQRLAYASSLRFSELKPDDLENNSFMYHLRQVISLGLVEKSDTGYALSGKGLTYIDSFSYHDQKPRKQPKVISILAVHNPSGQWLLARRKVQPYIGKYMFPSGKQHFGESPELHVKRELREKLGLELPMRRRGLADIRIHRDEQLVTHVTAHIYQAEASDSDDLPLSTERFEYEWLNPESDVPSMGGTRELMSKLTHEPDLFFLSLDARDI